ncbi:12705_t:CDS:2, partial [Racocetra persica]
NINNLTATDQNYDDNAHDNNFEDNVHDNNFKVAINIPHSVSRHNTTRIRNKRRTSAKAPRILSNRKENDSTLSVKRSLEDLFLKKKCDWNPKKFTNTAVAKRLCLDDNPIEN